MNIQDVKDNLKVQIDNSEDEKIIDVLTTVLNMVNEVKEVPFPKGTPKKIVKEEPKKKVSELPKETPESKLENLDGVTPEHVQELLKKFGTVEGIKNAKVSELTKISGIGKKRAEEILEVLK